MMTLENAGEQRTIGDGVLEDRNLGFRVEFADGSGVDICGTDVRLGRVDEATIPLNLPPEAIDLLIDGYTVIVDPYNEIAELNEDNNEYHGP